MNFIVWSSIFIVLVFADVTPTPDNPVKTLLKSNQPSLLEVSENIFDFGIIYPGKNYNHDFTIQNTSQKIIRIKSVKSDCGCQVTFPDGKIMNPGDKRTVHIEMTPPNRTGTIQKSIIVYLDLPAPDNWIEFQLQAEVKSITNINPEFVYFKKLYYGEGAEAKVSIEPEKGYDFRITKVEDPEKLLKLTINPPIGENSGSEITTTAPKIWELTLKLDPQTPPGRIYTEILIHTDSSLQPQITIPVMGVVRGRVAVWPTQAYLGILHPGESIEKIFLVESKDDSFQLQIPAVTSTLSDADFQIDTKDDAKSFKIRFTFTIPKDYSGRLDGMIHIKTNDPFQEIIDIPVFGYIPSQSDTTPTPFDDTRKTN